MRYPAAIPAVAILLGTTAASCLHLAARWPAAAAVGALAAALVAYRRHRSAFFALAVGLSFACTAWASAVGAFRDMEAPALRAALAGSLPTTTPAALQGVLRADAAPTPNGVSLDLQLTDATAEDLLTRTAPAHAVPSAHRLRGGVRLTVAGSLAADRADEWRAGRTIRVQASLREPGRSRDPGVPDSRLDLARRGTVLLGGVKSGALVELVEEGSSLDERAADLRRFARAAISRYVGRWSTRSAAIVIAILIGDRVGLDDEVQRRLREAGTYHVIAISGGNIAILAGLLFALLRLARVPTRLSCWLVMAGLAGYATLVGGGASVVRATLMAIAYLAARQADHHSPPLNALAVACAVILLATPLALGDVGFALTFGATLGILVGGRMVAAGTDVAGFRPAPESREPPGGAPWSLARFLGAHSRHRWLRAPAALLFASLSAELALFPVSAFAFSRVTFAGLLLNFMAIPLMSVAQVAGMLVLPLSAIADGPASLVGWVAHLGADGLVRSAGLLDLAPWLSWRLPPPHPAALACYYGAWCAWPWLRPGRPGGVVTRRLRRLVCLPLIVLSGGWILIEPVTLLFPGVCGRLRVTVLDVGHADAVLVQLPDRRSLLVDAGGSMTGGSFDVGGRVVAPALWALGTRRLDALVISHGDPDHVGGAASVMRDFRPREVWEGIPVPGSQRLAQLHEQALHAGAAWHERRAGERFTFGDVTLRIYHPPEPEWQRPKVRNDDSIVLEVRYGDVSVVLPGDVGGDVERTLAPQLAPAGLCVLKVPHHGSATSSSAELLAAAHPDIAIISAAATTKVKDEVLARYRSIGTTIFRTSDDGAVIVTTDGRSVMVETCTGRTGRFTVDQTTKDTKDTKKTTEE